MEGKKTIQTIDERLRERAAKEVNAELRKLRHTIDDALQKAYETGTGAEIHAWSAWSGTPRARAIALEMVGIAIDPCKSEPARSLLGGIHARHEKLAKELLEKADEVEREIESLRDEIGRD